MIIKDKGFKIEVFHRLSDGTLIEQKNMFWNDSLSFHDVIEVIPYLINNENLNHMIISLANNTDNSPPDEPQ